MVGALGFGWLTDRFGRKRLFTVTLGGLRAGHAGERAGLELRQLLRSSAALTAAGIGGEGAAMDSAIDELIPARRRGQVSINIHGSFWVGAGLGSLASVVLLNPRVLPPTSGWRFAFIGGALLALVIVYARRFLPGEPALADHPRPPRRGASGSSARSRRAAA